MSKPSTSASSKKEITSSPISSAALNNKKRVPLNSAEVEHPKVTAKDRSDILEGLAGGYQSAIAVLNDKMKGASSAEVAMLKQEIAVAQNAMLQCKNLAEVERDKKDALAQKNISPEVSKKREEGKKWLVSSGLNEKISEALKKINDIAALGFESDVSMQFGRSVTIRVDARMPEEFKGKDPTKFSTSELNAAKEALSVQSKFGADKDEKKDVGRWTHSVLLEGRGTQEQAQDVTGKSR